MPYYSSLKDLPERVSGNLPEHASVHIHGGVQQRMGAVQRAGEKKRRPGTIARSVSRFQGSMGRVEKEYKEDEIENG